MFGLDTVIPEEPPKYVFRVADIRDPEELKQLGEKIQPDTVIHLAANREVVTPWERVGDLLTTNVIGTFNTLAAMNVQKFIFISSSAVYGNCQRVDTIPSANHVVPISEYGMSKVSGELVCRDWVRESGGVAIILRLGNVVGRGCHGLLDYIVNHMKKCPDGLVPAELRGGGQLIRDYVPVSLSPKFEPPDWLMK